MESSEASTVDAPGAPAEPPKKEQGLVLPGAGMKSLVPKNFDEATAIARLLATSDIVPKEMQGKPANVLLCIMHGTEIGLSPAQALSSIMVVNGRPSIWGDAMLGLVLSSGLCESWKSGYNDENGGTAWFTVKRKGQEPVTRYFSEEDAVAAGLVNKPGPWKQYKRRMKFHRSRSWALRDVFPDVLKGIGCYEEQRDIELKETAPGSKEFGMPKRASESTTPETTTEVIEAKTEPPKEEKAVAKMKTLTKNQKTKKLGFVIEHKDEPGKVYSTLTETIYKYIVETTKAGKTVLVEWEQGIGQRDIVSAIAEDAPEDEKKS